MGNIIRAIDSDGNEVWKLADDAILKFGDGDDVEVEWDGSKLAVAVADQAGVGNIEPIRIDTKMTGAGATGGRVRINLEVAAILGGWSNALKAQVDYAAAGRTAGIGSAICAEMALSAGCSAGTYAPLEIELGIPSDAVLGTKTAFMYLAVYGADKSNMDDDGVLFKLDGLTMASGKLFQENTAAAATHALKIDIGGTLYYVMLTSAGV